VVLLATGALGFRAEWDPYVNDGRELAARANEVVPSHGFADPDRRRVNGRRASRRGGWSGPCPPCDTQVIVAQLRFGTRSRSACSATSVPGTTGCRRYAQMMLRPLLLAGRL
jgi:hypothetical protein